MYNLDCKLVEFCAVKKYNNFEICLIGPGHEFIPKTQNKIETNTTSTG